jgi:hypothetical protein
MKRAFLALAVLLAAAGVYTRRAVHAQGESEYEFTVVERVGLIGKPAAATNDVSKTYFRRADGTSGSIIRETRNGHTATTVSYKSPKENAEIAAVVGRGVRVTYPMPPEVVQLWFTSPHQPDCAASVKGLKKTAELQLSGVNVQRLWESNTVEDVEYYAAPSLGCATLKAHHLWKDSSGTFTSWTDVELVSLKLGPPDPGYFDLHLGARDVRPSEFRTEVRALLYPGEATPDCYAKGNMKVDAAYQKARDAAARNWALLPQPPTATKTPTASR